MSEPMDAAAVTSRWLRDQTEITDIVEQRVWTKVPTKPLYPFVDIDLFHHSRITGRARWAYLSVLQITCYGNTRVEAFRLAQLVEGLADDMVGTHAGEGVVTGVKLSDIRQAPDTISKPARDAYTLDLHIYHHPPKGEAS